MGESLWPRERPYGNSYPLFSDRQIEDKDMKSYGGASLKRVGFAS